MLSQQDSNLDTMALSASERSDLTRLETIIRSGIHAFIEVGNALCEIRDRELYRASHRTFADYCAAEWNLGKAQAYRLMNAAEVVGNLSPIGDVPRCVSVLRPLTDLEPDQQREVWAKAVETAPDRTPTAKHVAAVKREVVPKAAKPEEIRKAESPSKATIIAGPRHDAETEEAFRWGEDTITKILKEARET